MHILVVDDEPKPRNGLKSLMEKLDSTAVVQVAEDGEQAVALCEGKQFDLIFTDIKMPRMDGLQLVKSLSRRGCQMVIVSGYADFAYAQQAIKYGVLDYVLKPIDPKKIAAILGAARLRLRSMRANCLRSYILNYDTMSRKTREFTLEKTDIVHPYALFVARSAQEELSEDSVGEYKNLISRLQEKYDGMETVVFVVKNSLAGVVTSKNPAQITAFEEAAIPIMQGFGQLVFSEIYEDLLPVNRYYQSLLERVDRSNQPPSAGDFCNIIRIVLDYIENNYARNITLGDLAEIVYVHPTYLSKLFKKEVDQNLSDYIMNFRIEKAKELLRDPRYKIYEIADAAGFKDPKYFGNVFKSIVGETPSQFRNKN